MPLTLDYRPKTFAEVVGQDHIVPVLKAFVIKDRPPPSLMFAGTSGSGKTSCARIYAAALNCPHVVDGNPCGVCSVCLSIQSNSSDAVIEIDAASKGGVDDIRAIREMCMYAHSLDWRVVIIDEAQALSKDAFKAILKITEEPPDKTTFLFLTTEPDSIPRPVQSRSIIFDFKSIPLVSVAERVQSIADDLGFKISPVLSARIAQRTNGHLRDAVMELDKCYQNDITTDADYVALNPVVDVSLDILACAAYNDVKRAHEKVDVYFSSTSDLKRFIDQLVSAVISVSRAYVGVPSNEGVVELARVLHREALTGVYDVLWSAYGNINSSHNPKIFAQILVQNIVSVLSVYDPPEIEILEKTPSEAILSSDTPITIEEAFALLD